MACCQLLSKRHSVEHKISILRLPNRRTSKEMNFSWAWNRYADDGCWTLLLTTLVTLGPRSQHYRCKPKNDHTYQIFILHDTGRVENGPDVRIRAAVLVPSFPYAVIFGGVVGSRVPEVECLSQQMLCLRIYKMILRFVKYTRSNHMRLNVSTIVIPLLAVGQGR